jgi:hypothetical protein
MDRIDRIRVRTARGSGWVVAPRSTSHSIVTPARYRRRF